MTETPIDTPSSALRRSLLWGRQDGGKLGVDYNV